MRNINYIVIGAAFLLCLSSSARAQGVLIDDTQPRVREYRNPISVKDHHVKVTIESQVSVTTVKQVFGNSSRRDLEATYLFPLPRGASITDFAMWMNGEKVAAELVEARRARKIYEDIVRRLKDPGLLEYLEQDLFRARVYPVPAGGDVRVEIVYHELLSNDGGLVSYRYPLHSHVGDKPARAEFSIDVDIEADTPIKNLYSPTYDVERRIDGTTANCSYEGTARRRAPDFVVYYTVSAEDVGLNLVTHRRRGDEGYFMALLSPGRLAQHRTPIARDVIFVIDRSGSMRGEKIEQAKEALGYCLHNLGEDDRFGIITFASAVTRFEDRLTPADRPGIRDAMQFVDEVRARGGTDINAALESALDVPSSGRLRQLIFLTDGQPTVGETEVPDILDNVRGGNRGGARLFVFGVGYDVNTRLLDKLAGGNHGTVSYVKPEESIEVAVASFYAKVSQPVLSDISLSFGKIRVSDVFPRELPDLFNGSQLVVFGRYKGRGSSLLELTGEVDGEEKKFTFEAAFEKRERRNEFIPRIWATRKVAYLMEEIRENGHDQELVDEVIELATEHGIVTPYTSFLILEEERAGRLSRSRVQSVFDAPESVARGARAAFESTTGRASVGMSQDLVAEKKKSVVDDRDNSAVRFIAGKTFYQQGGVWLDAEYEDGMKTVAVKFLTDDYFKLIEKHPELARYLSLGSDVTCVLGGVAYVVTG
ncbi:MAG: VIT domain-containing protein [Candidatus Krumholzibacteriia bacterium]